MFNFIFINGKSKENSFFNFVVLVIGEYKVFIFNFFNVECSRLMIDKKDN